MPGPGIEPPISCMPSGRANHYTPASLYEDWTVVIILEANYDGGVKILVNST